VLTGVSGRNWGDGIIKMLMDKDRAWECSVMVVRLFRMIRKWSGVLQHWMMWYGWIDKELL